MDETLNQRIELGLTRVPNTPDLGKADVSGPMHAVYDDIEATLRVPFVNFIFRTLANFPDYFLPGWKALSPQLRRLACERAGRRLRSLAAHNIAVQPVPWEMLNSEDRRAIGAFTDAIHYALPKLLLTATAFDMHASGGFVFNPASTAAEDALIPYGIVRGTGQLPLLDPTDADGRVRSLFEDIRQHHGHPGVASYYRGLGHYPEFLEHAWRGVRRHVDTDDYRQREQTVLADAETIAARELVHPAPGPADPAPDAVREILAVFRYRLIPDLLLDVTLIKAMRDGPQTAAHSRFCAAD